jgi:hypothetical protein
MNAVAAVSDSDYCDYFRDHVTIIGVSGRVTGVRFSMAVKSRNNHYER